MTTNEVLLAVAIPSVVVFLVGVVVLFVAIFLRSDAWFFGVKLIGVAVFLPLVVGGVAFFVHDTVIGPIGRLISVAQIALGVGLVMWVLRLHADREI